ncbi:hypothetical protein BJ170DRAFT_681485 [Xylariales sp. AK1849]|nr:hypothetical protein BJ170DRAFT_681485 [Xylariales sp. AK1849]
MTLNKNHIEKDEETAPECGAAKAGTKIPSIKNENKATILATRCIDGLTSLRVVVNNSIKYLTVDEDVIPDGWQGSLSILPEFPPTDIPTVLTSFVKCFHIGLVTPGERGKGKYAKIFPYYKDVPNQVDGIEDVSHDVSFDYFSLTKIRQIVSGRNTEGRREDRLNVVSHPDIEGSMLMKIVEFPRDLPGPQGKSQNPRRAETLSRLMANEIKMTQKAAEDEMAPHFHGLVTEAGRGIIGFVSEFIEGAKSFQQLKDEGALTEEDATGCINLVHQLHVVSDIVHGDLVLDNILRRPDGSSVLIDFEYAEKSVLAPAKDQEITDLEDELREFRNVDKPSN